jgi:hypothetical protein
MELTIKGVKFIIDEGKLSAETKAKVLAKGLSRIAFERETGKGQTDEALAKSLSAIAADPEKYYSTYGTRGEGVSRPKLDMYERKAKSWFSAEFMPAVKGNVVNAVTLWKKAGAVSNQLSVPKEATADVKETVAKNQEARDKLIAAKAKKLKESGWEPELI